MGSTSHGAFREARALPSVRMQPPSHLTLLPFCLLLASSSTAPASVVPQKLPTSERSSCCHRARRGINDSSLCCCEWRCVSSCGTIDFPSCELGAALFTLRKAAFARGGRRQGSQARRAPASLVLAELETRCCLGAGGGFDGEHSSPRLLLRARGSQVPATALAGTKAFRRDTLR